MYPINSAILAKYQNGDKQYARVTIGSTVIGSDRIMQGGFNVNRLSETDDTVKIGSCSAAEFTLVLNNRDGAYDDYDFIGKEAHVEVGVEYNNSVSYLPIGYFIFDEAGYDKSALRLASLDRMIKFERTIDPAQLTFPMTVTQLLGRLCTVCGVPLGTFPTLLNGGISVPSLPKDAKTYRDLLVWIAEISGNVAYIDYSGNLMLGWYNGSQFRITPDIRRDGTLERGSILVTGVEIVVNDTTTLEGTDARTIRVENNPLIPAGQESFIATGLFNKVGGFSYTPFSASVLPMPHIFPLDGATYVTASGDETYVPITSWTFTLNGGTKIAGTGNQATYRRGYGLADAILQGVNLADKAVTTEKIADNAVDTAQLAALAVKEGNLAANAVTEGKIAVNAVVADKIAAGAVSTDKLAALAVTSAKIAAGAITADKIYVEDLSALRATIAGWTINETNLASDNNAVVLDSNGTISVTETGTTAEGAKVIAETDTSKAYYSAWGVRVDNPKTHGINDAYDDVILNDDGLITEHHGTGLYNSSYTNINNSPSIVLDRVRNVSNQSSEWKNEQDEDSITITHKTGSTTDKTYFFGNDGTSAKFKLTEGTPFVQLQSTTTGAYITTTEGSNTAQLFCDGDEPQLRLDDTHRNTQKLYRGRLYNMYYNGTNKTNYSYLDEGILKLCKGDGDLRNSYPTDASHVLSMLGTNSLVVNTHDLLRMAPHFAQMFATEITSGKDIKTTPYLKCGQYYTVSDVITQSLSNCPTRQAFTMFVLSPISTTYDNESSSTYVYRIRIIIDLMGRMWVQSVYSGSTAGSFYYNTWNRIVDVPTSVAYTAVTSATAAGLTLSTSLGNTRYRKVGQMVEVNISVSGANTSWQTVFTLPSDYRPQEAFYAPISTLTMGSAGAYFAANGDVMVKVPSGSGVTVGGTITFPVVT